MLTIDSIVSNAYREENTMSEITIRNAFGKEYTVDAKTRDEIEKIIDDMDYDMIVKMAYGAHSNIADGVVDLNIESGEFVAGSYTQGTGDIETHFVTIYTVPQNLDLESDIVAMDEDREEAEKEGLGVWEYMEKAELIDERQISALQEMAFDYFRSEEFNDSVKEQLDRIYRDRKKIEKFTSADVFADNENDTLIDEGYFTENGFHSTTLIESDKNKDCECKTRTQHVTHLQEILEREDAE